MRSRPLSLHHHETTSQVGHPQRRIEKSCATTVHPPRDRFPRSENWVISRLNPLVTPRLALTSRIKKRVAQPGASPHLVLPQWEVHKRSRNAQNHERLTPARLRLDVAKASNCKRFQRQRSPAPGAMWARRTNRLVWYRQSMPRMGGMSWTGQSLHRQCLPSRLSRVSIRSTTPGERKDTLRHKLLRFRGSKTQRPR
jgi:hypothetical protein